MFPEGVWCVVVVVCFNKQCTVVSVLLWSQEGDDLSSNAFLAPRWRRLSFGVVRKFLAGFYVISVSSQIDSGV